MALSVPTKLRNRLLTALNDAVLDIEGVIAGNDEPETLQATMDELDWVRWKLLDLPFDRDSD